MATSGRRSTWTSVTLEAATTCASWRARSLRFILAFAGLGRAVEVELHGQRVKILSLADLIRSKAASGRAKDLVDLESLRAIESKG